MRLDGRIFLLKTGLIMIVAIGPRRPYRKAQHAEQQDEAR